MNQKSNSTSSNSTSTATKSVRAKTNGSLSESDLARMGEKLELDAIQISVEPSAGKVTISYRGEKKSFRSKGITSSRDTFVRIHGKDDLGIAILVAQKAVELATQKLLGIGDTSRSS